MQHPDNFSISNEKSANGSFSLKYESDITIGSSLKAHGSAAIPDMKIDLDAGTYPIKAMVWIDPAAEITALQIQLKSLPGIIFNLSGKAKGEWVEISENLVLNSAVTDSNFIIRMEPSYGGKGVLYIDDIQLFDEAPPEVKTILPTTEIKTEGSENLFLEKGNYEIDLKVWVDEESNISDFYTIISEPWVNTKWDISEIEKGEWVELKKEIVLDTKADDSEFRVKINNNSESKGFFYLDDITITKTNALYEASDNFTIQTIGETCPNKGNGQIKIMAKESDNYFLKFSGTDHNFTNELILDDIDPGNYDVCISVIGTDFEACHGVEVKESDNITGKISTSKNSNSVSISIDQGTAPFIVSVNGLEILTTYSDFFNVTASSGDLIKVKSNKDCEGAISKKLNTIKVFPNPITDILNVLSSEGGDISIYNILGETVFFATDAKGEFSKPISLPEGTYVIKMISKDKVFTEKIVIK